MRNYRARDVDAYIASSEPKARPILKELQRIIKLTTPKVEEKISWGVPFYKYHGLLGGFSAFKNHVSFGLCDVLRRADRKMLEKKVTKQGRKPYKSSLTKKCRPQQ